MGVAFAALIIALSGTALGAVKLVNGDRLIRKNSLSGNRLRRHTVTGAQIKASSLPKVPSAARADSTTHAASADSATHATGADSATNATTADSATHATGADSATAAASPGTLASGKTLQGVYDVGGQAASGGAQVAGSITFTFPLASAPALNIINNGMPSTANCPGSLSDPRAAAGNFCLYEGKRTNVSFLGVGDPIADAGGKISRFGGNVNVAANAAGFFADAGSWAVTAS
jgi:hypothetical protein